MNKYIRISLHILYFALYILPIFLVINGVGYFSKYTNITVLFSIHIFIAIISIYLCRKQIPFYKEIKYKKYSIYSIIILFILVIISIVYYFNIGIHKYGNYETFSDVIPQLKVLYERYSKGVQPYAPLEMYSHKPYPVYMPAHWLILAPAYLLNFDLRWIGIIILLITIFSSLLIIRTRFISLLQMFFGLIISFVAILSYCILAKSELFVTFETPIAAYYIILAIGLANRNLVWITIGIILCLLSRYTVVFWLPLFCFIAINELTLKQNILMFGAILSSIILFYILPFLIIEPNLLSIGIAYHNNAAIADWFGYGIPPISWTQETGVSFGPILKLIFSGDAEQEVYKTRVLQAFMMIALNIIGLLIYKKYKGIINYFDIALIMLYLILVFFYIFSPLTYRYYYITIFTLSSIVYIISTSLPRNKVKILN